jgi:tetratricopeptide (TPR) repeat protein
MIEKILKRIDKLAKEHRYEEALGECNKLLKEVPMAQLDILRMRSRIHARCNDFEQSLIDFSMIVETGEATIRDYYSAADCALSAGKFAQAASCYKEVLRLGEEQNETWFRSASFFLLAYAQMELGQFQEANQNLDSAIAAEANVAMPVPSMCGMCTHQQLREEIRHRMNSRNVLTNGKGHE